MIKKLTFATFVFLGISCSSLQAITYTYSVTDLGNGNGFGTFKDAVSLANVFDELNLAEHFIIEVDPDAGQYYFMDEPLVFERHDDMTLEIRGLGPMETIFVMGPTMDRAIEFRQMNDHVDQAVFLKNVGFFGYRAWGVGDPQVEQVGVKFSAVETLSELAQPTDAILIEDCLFAFMNGRGVDIGYNRGMINNFDDYYVDFDIKRTSFVYNRQGLRVKPDAAPVVFDPQNPWPSWSSKIALHLDRCFFGSNGPETLQEFAIEGVLPPDFPTTLKSVYDANNLSRGSGIEVYLAGEFSFLRIRNTIFTENRANFAPAIFVFGSLGWYGLDMQHVSTIHNRSVDWYNAGGVILRKKNSPAIYTSNYDTFGAYGGCNALGPNHYYNTNNGKWHSAYELMFDSLSEQGNNYNVFSTELISAEGVPTPPQDPTTLSGTVDNPLPMGYGAQVNDTESQGNVFFHFELLDNSVLINHAKADNNLNEEDMLGTPRFTIGNLFFPEAGAYELPLGEEGSP